MNKHDSNFIFGDGFTSSRTWKPLMRNYAIYQVSADATSSQVLAGSQYLATHPHPQGYSGLLQPRVNSTNLNTPWRRLQYGERAIRNFTPCNAFFAGSLCSRMFTGYALFWYSLYFKLFFMLEHKSPNSPIIGTNQWKTFCRYNSITNQSQVAS